MPLQRRLPKRGFRSPFRRNFAVVNLGDLAGFPADAVVDPAALRERGLVKRRLPVKILGKGELTHALTVRVHALSGRAKECIVAAGGSVEVLDA